ncbi:MAG TPA: SRPBCC domain-containing protein [candidate division Zixibacteria bacterium]|nr:SRPBCC domain-containing protein [candidate division Zixibacteria bacterium]
MVVPKKFDWSQFTLNIAIKAAPSKVYKAWTDSKEICKWFAYDAEVEPKKGGKFSLTDIYGNSFDMQMLGARKDSRIHFTFGMNDEQVEVKLKKSGRYTVCELHQFNMKTSPNHKWDTHMEQRAGWTFFLTNLKAWLEHGIDLRSHDDKWGYADNFVNS